MTSYLNPKIINLDDIDFIQMPVMNIQTHADFCIVNAGTIYDLFIELDRTTNTLTKSTLQNGFNIDNTTPTFFVSDSTGDIADFVVLNENITESFFHINLLNSINTKNILHGAIFTLIVKSIFADIDTSLIDFNDENIRANTIFFQTDATDTVINNVILKTEEVFNNITIGINDEFTYWNIISHGLSQIPFENNNHIYVIYSINIQFISGHLENMNYSSFINLDALSATGNLVTPFSNADFNYIFALSWNLQYTEPEPEQEPEPEPEQEPEPEPEH